MHDRGDHRKLVVPGFLVLARRARVIEQFHIGADRHVIPGIEPQAGNSPPHVFMIQPAFAPGRVSGRARHQRFERAFRFIEIGQYIGGRKMPYLLVPVHFRFGRGEAVIGRNPGARWLIQTRRNLCAKRIVDIVQPRDEKAARDASRIPIALLLESAHFANTGSCRHRHHRLVRRMVHASERQLPFRRGRATEGTNIPVGKFLRRKPAQRVIAISLRLSENFILPFGKIAAPLILHNEHKTPLHRPNGVAQRSALDIMLTIRCFPKDDRKRPLALFRGIYVGRQTDPVAHRHQDRQLCIGTGGQFGFQRLIAIFGIILSRNWSWKSDRRRNRAQRSCN